MENIIVVCQYKIYKMEKIFFQFHHSNCKNIIDDEKYHFLLLLLLFPNIQLSTFFSSHSSNQLIN